MNESMNSNARDTIRDGDGGERGAIIIESIISNARDRSIESDDTLAVLVGVANDICTKDIFIIWSDDITIGGGIGDLPGWVDRRWAIFLDERCNAI